VSSATGATGGDPGRTRRWSVFLGIAGTVVILDQLSKAWVDASFAFASPLASPGEPGGPTPVVADLLRIAKVANDGGIFGLFGESAPLLGAASVLVIAGIVWYHARSGAQGWPFLTLGLAFLLGGAIGNLIDRIRLGYVIDWVDAGIGDLRWYTFNVADAAISIGLVLLFVFALFGDRLAAAAQGRDTASERTS
jgi:signal peptidase II